MKFFIIATCMFIAACGYQRFSKQEFIEFLNSCYSSNNFMFQLKYSDYKSVVKRNSIEIKREVASCYRGRPHPQEMSLIAEKIVEFVNKTPFSATGYQYFVSNIAKEKIPFEYLFEYQYFHQGIVCRSRWITVLFERDGQLKYYFQNDSYTEVSGNLKLSREQAYDSFAEYVVKQHVVDERLQITRVSEPVLCYVHPNTYAGASYTGEGGRLAYEFKLKYGKNNSFLGATLWIDAENGAFLGGRPFECADYIPLAKENYLKKLIFEEEK